MKHVRESIFEYVLFSKISNDVAFVDTDLDKEHPLAGAVLCFTSVLPEQRVSASISPIDRMRLANMSSLISRLNFPRLRVRWERLTSTI